MTTHMLLDRIELVGVNGDQARYDFKAGINVVHGETASGKTSLLELIKYVLGGSANLSQAVQEGVKYATVALRLGPSRYVMRRHIGANTLTVSEPDGTLLEEVSIRRRKTMRRASDFLLEAAELPEVKLTSTSSDWENVLSFWDFYPYVYVRQSEIDRSVVNHLDGGPRNRKRRAAFELLLGLSTVEVATLRAARDELAEQWRASKRDLSVINSFLDELDLHQIQDLETYLADLDRKLASARNQLQLMRESGRVHNDSLDQRQRKLRSALEDSHRMAKQIAEIEARIHSRVETRFELESDRERTQRGGTATDLLGTMEFHQCPRCLQAVTPYRLGDDFCYVCGQDEPRPEADEANHTEDDLERIDALLLEVAQLIDEDRLKLDRMLARRRALELLTRDLGRELDNMTDEYVSPLFEEISAVSERIGALREERNALSVQVDLWEQRAKASERTLDFANRVDAANGDLDAAEAQLASTRAKMAELSDLFDEIVRSLNMPWYDPGLPAYIDSTSYLPIVNGVKFQELSSGGMKMMTNVAYHLALLTHGLAEGDTRVPTLLIIDSPRKNLGATPEDVEHSNRFYSWVDGLVRAYERDFQIIIADNDPPPDAVQVAMVRGVSHEEPVVPGHEHPGDEAAPIA